jgi:outer membrane protein assembly factor BamB
MLLALASTVTGAAQVSPAPPVVTLGPWLQFTGSASAVVRWHTSEAMPSIVELLGPGAVQRFEGAAPSTSHEVALNGLAHNTAYRYRLVLGDGRATPDYDCETDFNYSLPDVPSSPYPFPDDPSNEVFASLAETFLSFTGVTRGYALVVGCGRGRLAYELARRSNLYITGIDVGDGAIAEARTALRQAGLYGARVTVRQVASVASLPFTKYYANLVISDRPAGNAELSDTAREWFRVMRPGGGRMLLGPDLSAGDQLFWLTLNNWLGEGLLAPAELVTAGEIWTAVTRGALEGIGEWSHQYGSPDNSARSGDTLLGATQTGEMQAQWLGEPGPRAMVDRNPRTPAPLYTNGRLFTQGFRRVIAQDAYNGAILWSLEIPYLERYNLPRDCSNWCADDHYVYLAVGNKCWKVNAADGKLEAAYDVLAPEGAKDFDWGYIARAGDTLFGSATKQNTVYTNFRGKNSQGWYDSPLGPVTYKVGSDTLFARDKETGELRWQYERGVILNTTITIADGTVFFAEARHPDVKAAAARRLPPKNLWDDLHLVALDAATGTPRWERKLDNVAKGVVVFFVQHANGMLLIASSDNKYHQYGFDAATGEPRWAAEHDWTGNDHSGHMQHPAVVGNTVYLEPCGYDITSGKRVTDSMGRHEGCATYAATEGALLYRGENRRISLWDVESGETTSWPRLRPSCWLSTVAGGGMVLSPEGGGGCSCGGWMETSIAFMRK